MSKVLVVDDEPDIIELIQNRLVQNGYDVISASDGAEGVKMAKSEVPDLIIMDVLMPNMSGGDAVRALIVDEKTKEIPVLFLTGVIAHDDRDNVQKGINVAGTYYPSMSKPFDSDKLIERVSDLLK